MTRVHPISPEKASAPVKEIYAAIEQKMGRVPNIFLNMGNSAAVLNGYLALSDAIEHTSLDAKLREKIALIVGQSNHCNYCLSAHTAIAQATGINEQEIFQARRAESKDAKTQAILSFAKAVVEKRGSVADQDVAALKSAGVSDAQIVEIILVITLNIFTNYFNHITDPKIDFPLAQKLI